MKMFFDYHETVYSFFSKTMEDKPQIGYLFATISTGGGLVGLLDVTLKILSIISVLLGIVVALYTLRLQRAQARKINQKYKLPPDNED